jgi:hypothetical protein
MSRARALIWGVLSAALAGLTRRGGSGRNLPVPEPYANPLDPKPFRGAGNNRKARPNFRARRVKWRMETASRAQNLGRKGQRRKGSR